MEFAILLLIYVIICIVVGNASKKYNLGYWGGVLISFFLSPIIGLLIMVLSGRKTTNVTVVNSNNSLSVPDELAKLKKLLDDEVITKSEYETQKSKLLNL